MAGRLKAPLKISMVVLNYDRPAETMGLLKSLIQQAHSPWEIIVVENGALGDPATMISTIYPEVKLIKSSRNLGVAAGRNLGARNCSGDIIFFLDNDAQAGPGVLDKIAEAFSIRPPTGIISLRIEDGCGSGLDMPSWVYAKALLPRFRERFFTYSFCGCGFALRRSLFKEAGGFIPEFFFCGEEDEFAIRAIRLGYDIEYRGDISVRHKRSRRRRVGGAGRLKYCLRNRLITIWMHYPLTQAIFMVFFRCAVYLEKGRRAGSLSVVPAALVSTIRLWRKTGWRRSPMDRETWLCYRRLNHNLQIRPWHWRRIRLEFQEPANSYGYLKPLPGESPPATVAHFHRLSRATGEAARQ